MRIAFIHPFLYRYPRGIERFLYRLASALAEAGAEVEILTWRWPDPVNIDTLDPRVRVRVLPTPRYFAPTLMGPVYAFHLARRRYDFVWVFFAGYGEPLGLRLASLVRRVRYGLTVHFPYSLVPHRYREFRRLGCARRAARVVAVSRFVADGVREALGREADVISTGVDVDRFRPAADRDEVRRRLGLAPADRVILTVAALEPRKGVQWVIDALPAVRAAHPTAVYVVVGDGPHRAELDARARAAGVADAVRLVGATGDVLPYYQAADVFALLSEGEAAPIAPREAMAAGLPVVLAAARPFDELATAGCGELVDPAAPAAVALAVGGLLADPSRAAAAGAAGRAHVAAHYSWAEIARRYLDCSRA